MKRSVVLIAILTAGCSDANQTESQSRNVIMPPPIAVDDQGSAADGELFVLQLPGMV